MLQKLARTAWNTERTAFKWYALLHFAILETPVMDNFSKPFFDISFISSLFLISIFIYLWKLSKLVSLRFFFSFSLFLHLFNSLCHCLSTYYLLMRIIKAIFFTSIDRMKTIRIKFYIQLMLQKNVNFQSCIIKLDFLQKEKKTVEIWFEIFII